MAELFARYEINRAPWWPRLSKVVVGSLVFHLLVGVTMKYVPVARGILSIARGVSDVEFVDEDYQRTIVEDRAIMLSLQGGRFQYPEGFFGDGVFIAPPPPPVIVPVATPPVVPLPQPVAPPSVAQLPTPAPLPPVPPSANDKGSKPANGTLPPIDNSDGKIAKNQPTPKPTASPTPAPPKTAEEAEALIAKTTAESNIPRPRREEINRKPIKDAFKRINEIKAQTTLNLEGNVEAVFTADRTPENRLENIAIISKKGDDSLVGMLSELVSAFGDSGAIKFLPEAKGYRVAFSFNGPTVKVIIDLETATPEAAKEQAGAYGILLMGARVKQKGQPEEVFLNNAKVSVSGKNLVFTCTVPREVTNDLIAKNLAENTPGAENTTPAQTP